MDLLGQTSLISSQTDFSANCFVPSPSHSTLTDTLSLFSSSYSVLAVLDLAQNFFLMHPTLFFPIITFLPTPLFSPSNPTSFLPRVVQKWPDPKIHSEIKSKPIRKCIPFLGLSNRHYPNQLTTENGKTEPRTVTDFSNRHVTVNRDYPNLIMTDPNHIRPESCSKPNSIRLKST